MLPRDLRVTTNTYLGVHKVRNFLAALDYNEHADRPGHANADGSKR